MSASRNMIEGVVELLQKIAGRAAENAEERAAEGRAAENADSFP